jgi:cell shape-determining protein MreC
MANNIPEIKKLKMEVLKIRSILYNAKTLPFNVTAMTKEEIENVDEALDYIENNIAESSVEEIQRNTELKSNIDNIEDAEREAEIIRREADAYAKRVKESANEDIIRKYKELKLYLNKKSDELEEKISKT